METLIMVERTREMPTHAILIPTHLTDDTERKQKGTKSQLTEGQ